jgi:hypothetical protein
VIIREEMYISPRLYYKEQCKKRGERKRKKKENIALRSKVRQG